MSKSLIAALEAAKNPLEETERKYPDGLTGNSATNFNAGIDKAIEIIRGDASAREDEAVTAVDKNGDSANSPTNPDTLIQKLDESIQLSYQSDIPSLPKRLGEIKQLILQLSDVSQGCTGLSKHTAPTNYMKTATTLSNVQEDK
jgi:hypothetical protein